MRLIVVSNRLPVTVKKDGNGYSFKQSSGGLVTALSGLQKVSSFVWIGWTGMEVPPEDKSSVMSQLKELNCVPVFISDNLAKQYYSNFSNGFSFLILEFYGLSFTISRLNTTMKTLKDINRLI